MFFGKFLLCEMRFYSGCSPSSKPVDLGYINTEPEIKGQHTIHIPLLSPGSMKRRHITKLVIDLDYAGIRDIKIICDDWTSDWLMAGKWCSHPVFSSLNIQHQKPSEFRESSDQDPLPNLYACFTVSGVHYVKKAAGLLKFFF
jgi:hypothetical protein